jgi:chromosome segregation protein
MMNRGLHLEGGRVKLVYIKRVACRNFKSFSGIIKLTFDKGFNIITGPNGSGKSNIIDAIQFVFGELGSKRMSTMVVVTRLPDPTMHRSPYILIMKVEAWQ